MGSLNSPAMSLPVTVLEQGVLDVHTKAPSSSPTSNARTLYSSRDRIPQRSLEEGEEDSDNCSVISVQTAPAIEVRKSTDHLLTDSPWQACHAQLVRSSAGPLLVLAFVNKPVCTISLSTIGVIRPATIGDALTNDDHAFILIVSCNIFDVDYFIRFFYLCSNFHRTMPRFHIDCC